MNKSILDFIEELGNREMIVLAKRIINMVQIEEDGGELNNADRELRKYLGYSSKGGV